MNEINVSKIIGAYPIGKQVYSPAYGNCFYQGLEANGAIRLKTFFGGNLVVLPKNGIIVDGGELMLYPSRDMRDWDKFSWKKGDVLTTNDEGRAKIYCIFTGWANDKYTSFSCEWQTEDIFLKWQRYNQYGTEFFHKANDSEIDEYFSRLLARYGGKVKFHKPKTKQTEFKDGDIVYMHTKNGLQYVFVHDVNKEMLTSYIVAYCITLEEFAHIETQYICRDNMIRVIHLATDSEKQQLFEALAKEGKRWNPDTKQIEDLPKKCEFEPFQKVLVRCKNYQKWKVDFFSHYDDSCKGFPYVCVSSRKSYCIPYNDQTKHLLGTTDEWKGGEG